LIALFFGTPPTKVYSAIPSPQQFAWGSTIDVTTKSSNSIKNDPKSRLKTKQILIYVGNPFAPTFVVNTHLLHLPIPCFVMKSKIFVFHIYHVPLYKEGTIRK
jgi:hypothetical protein